MLLAGIVVSGQTPIHVPQRDTIIGREVTYHYYEDWDFRLDTGIYFISYAGDAYRYAALHYTETPLKIMGVAISPTIEYVFLDWESHPERFLDSIQNCTQAYLSYNWRYN